MNTHNEFKKSTEILEAAKGRNRDYIVTLIGKDYASVSAMKADKDLQRRLKRVSKHLILIPSWYTKEGEPLPYPEG